MAKVVVPGMIDPPAPVHPHYYTVRLDPDQLRVGFPPVPDRAVWMAMPHHLVFGANPNKDATTLPYPKGSTKAIQFPPVKAAMTNMLGTTDALSRGRLACLGVCVDYIPYSHDIKQNQDSLGRFSVMFAGEVTVACNAADVEDISIGDPVYYTYDEAGIEFEDAPQHATVRLTGTPPPYGAMIDDHFARTNASFEIDEPMWRELHTLFTNNNQLLGKLLAKSPNHNECQIMLKL